jgi:tRNA(Ile2) C34 agmatinyltransferase TiaS
MGLFSKPKCPDCSGQLTQTGYSFPFPQWRCKRCIKRNKEKKAFEERINRLENIIHKQLKTNE